MPEVHLVVGVCLIAANLVAGIWGGVSWLEHRPTVGFWYALRIAQATVILQALLGLALAFSGHHADKLHYLYGALPLVVNAYFATGASDWYGDAERAGALLEGWRKACARGRIGRSNA